MLFVSLSQLNSSTITEDQYCQNILKIFFLFYFPGILNTRINLEFSN